MFFTECASLAEQHPALASVFEQLDSQLRAMGTAEVIRSDDLASFLNIDSNQMRSALDMFAQVGVLLRVEMIECAYCQMAAFRSEYQEALIEDDEYRCTSCDRPLTDRTIQIITAYRSGENWGPTAPRSERSSTAISSATLLEDGWYTHSDLAEVFEVGSEALRKRLERYRKRHLDCSKEAETRSTREPRYLYRFKDVKGVIQDLQASSERPAK
jgi:transcription initiation factor IIE alpha subunit